MSRRVTRALDGSRIAFLAAADPPSAGPRLLARGARPLLSTPSHLSTATGRLGAYERPRAARLVLARTSTSSASPRIGARWGNDDEVIRAGDMIHSRRRIQGKYLRLLKDHQELAYLLRPGESGPAQGFLDAMAQGIRLQEIFTGAWASGGERERGPDPLSHGGARGGAGPAEGHYFDEPGPLMGASLGAGLVTGPRGCEDEPQHRRYRRHRRAECDPPRGGAGRPRGPVPAGTERGLHRARCDLPRWQTNRVSPHLSPVHDLGPVHASRSPVHAAGEDWEVAPASVRRGRRRAACVAGGAAAGVGLLFGGPDIRRARPGLSASGLTSKRSKNVFRRPQQVRR